MRNDSRQPRHRSPVPPPGRVIGKTSYDRAAERDVLQRGVEEYKRATGAPPPRIAITAGEVCAEVLLNSSATARKLLWHAERGFFFDRKPDGEWLDGWTYAGLLPLWAGLADDAQASAIKKHLLSEKFWVPAGVTTVARDDPKFKKDMWRGPVWVHMNCLMIEGLRRHGWTKDADELRTKTMNTIETWYHKTGTFAEFYDPDNQTPPSELARKADEVTTTPSPAMADCNWTAALYADLLLRPKR